MFPPSLAFFMLNKNLFLHFLSCFVEYSLLVGHINLKMWCATLHLRLRLKSIQSEVIKENSLMCLVDNILLYISGLTFVHM